MYVVHEMYDVHNMTTWNLPDEPRGRLPTLSRARIVDAAVAIADAEGVQAATMRRIATEVGSTTPMSLYRYVGSKDGLADLMLEAVNAEIETPDQPTGHWRDDLRLLGLNTWAALERHLWYAELVHTRPPFGPHALRCYEFGLATLDGLGLDTSTMMTYVSMINGHAIGAALQVREEQKMRQQSGLENEDEFREAAKPLHEQIIASGRFPTFSRWLREGARFSEEDGFEVTLDVLLDGIAAQLEIRR